uniref:Uncharacterized protein n=1 Tax=Chromera velia CCMP2878 TaxID=1169474 RepID=A0A0G4FZD6_9ALVE|eukprot:Cvel_3954.t1-p1 / transcript=Cvel_3954.t1 / gene=Cvel_3954 / organism=Chromera_velia_CCMP2878 / gene_product=hypothetical protein / transcript_product=hypothetical protein / location=Cvel_scaffold168:24088-24798(+) / protein_length=237 / sequence_SO=supercontig / SO=protein_coding / is_pseudo=false
MQPRMFFLLLVLQSFSSSVSSLSLGAIYRTPEQRLRAGEWGGGCWKILANDPSNKSLRTQCCDLWKDRSISAPCCGMKSGCVCRQNPSGEWPLPPYGDRKNAFMGECQVPHPNAIAAGDLGDFPYEVVRDPEDSSIAVVRLLRFLRKAEGEGSINPSAAKKLKEMASNETKRILNVFAAFEDYADKVLVSELLELVSTADKSANTNTVTTADKSVNNTKATAEKGINTKAGGGWGLF